MLYYGKILDIPHQGVTFSKILLPKYFNRVYTHLYVLCNFLLRKDFIIFSMTLLVLDIIKNFLKKYKMETQ